MKKRIFLSPPHMGEKELEFVQEAFSINYIAPIGPQVDAFEKEFADYTGIPHCVALASGTAAMHLALKALNIGPGDDVIASTLTFIGSVSPITFMGGKPVFVDCDRSTWNMDLELLEKALDDCQRIGELPKAIVPTDLYGQCCDLPGIVEIGDRFGVPVICDSAEAMGANYLRAEGGGQRTEDRGQRSEVRGQRTEDRGQRAEGGSPDPATLNLESGTLNSESTGQWLHAGKGAKATVFSFNGNKILTTSGGGMLASEDGQLIDYARFLSQQARDSFIHYQHSEIGYNYRMSNILAAIGLGQLKVLEERVRRKREIFDYYFEALQDAPGIEFMPEAPYSRSNRWLTVILITPEVFGADREQVRLALEAEAIESRPVWKPMHLQPVFRVEGVSPDGLRSGGGEKQRYPARVVGGSVSEELFDKGLCLPSGTAMSNSDLDRIVEILFKCSRAR